MKGLFATAALVVVVSAGSPATAQVYGDQWSNSNDPSLGAFAQVQTPILPRRTFVPMQNPDGRVHSPNPAFDVYDTSNQYISSDPDAFIRNDLARNPPTRGD